MVGSSFCSVLAYLFKRTYGGENLETLVHGAVIAGSVGLVGFGLAGLALGTHGRLGRYPMALVLAVGTVVVGTRLVLGIHAGVALPCSPRLCYRGFEEPWVQVLIAFNVAFLAALFLVQAWRASRSSGEDDSLADWVFASGGGGPPFLPLTLKSIILGTRSTVGGALPPRTGSDKHHVMGTPIVMRRAPSNRAASLRHLHGSRTPPTDNTPRAA